MKGAQFWGVLAQPQCEGEQQVCSLQGRAGRDGVGHTGLSSTQQGRAAQGWTAGVWSARGEAGRG